MQTAKLFNNGRSQAVRLPVAFRFEGDKVYIYRDEATGNVILSKYSNNWDEFIALAQSLEISEEEAIIERDTREHIRDPFEDWQE
ncbi:antitoxin [Conservatibacter flavescens]|uniref:AbrB/MazE/SpoVT family DNA-binding domain-containing protein n=1 Tax=Conservatibacter flavescens TaxID=28161 RepID=A0A2M8S2I2_9PAST|nr:AbrB/MazE/SpoVT family DNA-binding domain-containing protein [Conservatibacter flavescens]PJG85337.1 AbrB/MazE/SpoVT family DNA-binding domain-containing protein [Conservatibacter flavescens]